MVYVLLMTGNEMWTRKRDVCIIVSIILFGIGTFGILLGALHNDMLMCLISVGIVYISILLNMIIEQKHKMVMINDKQSN